MDKSEEIVQLLGEIRDLLREGTTKQAEVIEHLRSESNRTKSDIDRSIHLQEISVKRQRLIQVVVVPVLLIALGVLVWATFKL
jgi:hypothetical protein